MQIFRFNTQVRAFHWTVAVPVVLLLCSGLLMTAHSLGLLPWFSKQTLLAIHTGFGFTFPLLPLLVLLCADRKLFAAEILPAFKVDGSDLQWGLAMLRSLWQKGVEVPPAAKFNGGQKMNAIMSLVWITTLCLSGFLMTVSKGNVLAHIIHIGAFSLFLPGLCVHLFMATINPSTRCSLGGMIHGYVPDHYLKHHHGLYFETFAPQIIGTLFVGQLTRKEDVQEVYRRVYEKKMSFVEFRQLKAGSEMFMGGWQDKELVLFFRVIGDGLRMGFVLDVQPFTLQADAQMIAHIIKGAEAVVGHPLTLAPEV